VLCSKGHLSVNFELAVAVSHGQILFLVVGALFFVGLSVTLLTPLIDNYTCTVYGPFLGFV